MEASNTSGRTRASLTASERETRRRVREREDALCAVTQAIRRHIEGAAFAVGVEGASVSDFYARIAPLVAALDRLTAVHAAALARDDERFQQFLARTIDEAGNGYQDGS